MSSRWSVQLFGRAVPWWAVALMVVIVLGVVVSFSLIDAGSRLEMAVERIEVGDAPQDVAVFGSVAWVVNGGDKTAQKISTIPMGSGAGTGTGRPVALGTLPGQVAITEAAIWVGAIEGDEITRIGPDGPQAVKVGRTPQSVAVGSDAIWAASFDDGSLWKISPTDERPIPEEFPLEEAFPSAIATGFGSVWIADVVANSVIRIDEATGEVTDEISVGDSPTAIAVGEGGVWVANYNDATITHIDPSDNTVVGQPIIVGARPGGIATGDGSVWVTRPESDSVIRIDPLENEWTGEVFEVGDGPQGIAVGAGSVWTADQGSDTVTRLTPKTQQD